jgi:hypothetical protein
MMRLIGTTAAIVALCVTLSAGTQGAATQGGAKGAKADNRAPSKPAPKWVRENIGSSEMTVELPGAPKATAVPLDRGVRASYDVLETISFSSEEFAAFASYAVTKAQSPISLDGAARGALDNVKGQADAPDYKETITSTTVLGLPARKIQCSFTAGTEKAKRKFFLSGVIFTDRSRMWQVICTGSDSPANLALANKVIASIKRSSSSG